MRKFIKNNLKTILVAGVTAIICISGTAFAAYYQYNAKQVEYKDGKSVETALNELYDNSKSNNIKGHYQFVKGNNKFVTKLGQIEFTSLGIKPNTYEAINNDTIFKCCTIEKILDDPIELKNKFEISSQIFIDNSKEKFAGKIEISLYEKKENNYNKIIGLEIGDVWDKLTTNYARGYYDGKSVGIPASWEKAWSNTNPSGRYSFIGDGNKFYLYRGNVLIGSADGTLSKEYSVDKIEITFGSRIGNEYLNLPMIIEDVYIGNPLFYKTIIN